MECSARLEDGRLIIENSRIRRVFDWNNGNLRSLSLTDPGTGVCLESRSDQPDLAIFGKAAAGTDALFEAAKIPATARTPAYLRVTVETSLDTLRLRRVFRVYPDCPALACDYFYRGEFPAAPPVPNRKSLAEMANIENKSLLLAGAQSQTIIDRICFPGRHWRFQSVEFRDITDRCNNLVREEQALAYLQPLFLTGNLLFTQDTTSAAESGFFVLKEAPCSSVQLHWPGADFMGRIGEVQVWGAGITAEDISMENWTRGYGVVTGVYSGGELGRLRALRAYQANLRLARPGRDHMVLLNTWGDRGQDQHICEEFALAELEAGARLGVSHFQLDDGWQQGQSSNSAAPGGKLTGIWAQSGFWDVHSRRFPRGLTPVAARALELEIELCIWFNPSADDSYAHWREDAEVLLRLNRDHGIRTFKIDGVKIPGKLAEENLRRMFETVMAATDNDAVFNLDVTAGRRYGYHYFNEYGNIFVENRYTDWGNYYPHWTLRNLWMLSRYVPAQSLQMEFLNKWRNGNVYPEADPLAPQRLDFDYLFAITMVAQPLAWFESANLPPEAFGTAKLIRLYREHQENLHAGIILPLGAEPDGSAWSGFQSLHADGGYVLVFREKHPRPRMRLQLWEQSRAGKLKFTALAGAAEDFTAEADAAGNVEFSLPRPFSFAWYRYETMQ